MMKYKTRDSDVSGDLDILLAKFSDTFTGDDIRKPAGVRRLVLSKSPVKEMEVVLEEGGLNTVVDEFSCP